MPRRVDHEERRREITEALWRIARKEGLAGVTLRRVAAEAGVSMNLVQYYFTTKDQMVRYGLERAIDLAVARMAAQIDAARTTGDPRTVLRAALVGQLPVDEAGRQLSAVYYAYLLYAITDDETGVTMRDIPRLLAADLVMLVEQASAAAVDASAEAESLVALGTGLAVGVLVGSYPPSTAVALVDHRLDHLYGHPAERRREP